MKEPEEEQGETETHEFRRRYQKARQQWENPRNLRFLGGGLGGGAHEGGRGMRYIGGMPVNGIALRTPNEGDAQGMIDMMLGCYAETEFLSCTPEEFQVSVEDEISFMQRFEKSERECMISAFADGRLVGNISVRQVSGMKRVRHRANLGVCVLKEYWGRGVGSMLMDAAIQTAQSAGYAQIELQTAADNERAIRLYQKFGFEQCGRCPRALKRESGYADEIEMVKFLK